MAQVCNTENNAMIGDLAVQQRTAEEVRLCSSVCPYDCPDACGLLFTVKGDKLQKVQGAQGHIYTRGTLCPKMVHYEATVHSPERLTTPLKRIGSKGEGKFVPIGWEEAITTIAENFKQTQALYGGESIMSYSYAGTMGIVQKAAGNALFAKLGASRQDRGICSPAKSHGWESVMGKTFAPRPQEAGESDFIVLWSLHAVATDIHFLHDVKAARANGAKVWAIDVCPNETTALADEVLLVKPGSDGALALGMAHVLYRDGLVDEDFLAKYVLGHETWQKEVVQHFTPAKAAEVTGLTATQIEALARAYGMARAPFIRLGSGLSRYGNGAMTVRTIVCLPALVGAWAKKGGGLLGSAGGSKFMGDAVMQREDLRPRATRLIPMITLGQALVATENPIKSLYIYSSNPAITLPDQNVVRRGLSREDLFTVVHERFMTDTAKYADLVLPATSSAEHDDIYNSYGHYTLACGYQAIPPVGASKSNWQVFALLAEALGYAEEEPFFRLTERELIEKIVQSAVGLTEVDKQRILDGEFVEVPLPEGYKLDFKTASGKIEIYNPHEPQPYPVYLPPHGDKADFWLINPPDVRILDSSFNERNFEGQPTMVLYMHPDDAKAAGVAEEERVVIYNERGEVELPLRLHEGLLRGTVVSPGIWWQKYSSDKKVSINAVTAARPTDRAWGSTFYDVKVNIRPL